MAKPSLPQESTSKPKRRRRKLPPNVVEKNGRWYVRLRYRGEDRKRHAAWRECAKNPTDAREVREALQLELKQHGHDYLSHAAMTFDNLADYFEKTYLKPAVFVDDQKIAGRRSLHTPKSALKQLRHFFGSQRLRAITHGNLEQYKETRLLTPVKFKKAPSRSRTIASVNRELSVLRRMFSIAVQEGWLQRSPFSRGDSLISPADEKQRSRILTFQEEARLLSHCVGARKHLRPLIICAIETGMRWGEMVKLRVFDVDIERGEISVHATHTKTLTARRVSVSPRLSAELKQIIAGKKPGDRLFTVSTVKRAWTTLREKAKLHDLRWHDLRHTNATRIERSGRVSAAQLARHLGHSDTKTTYRYVAQDEDSIKEIARVLDEFNAAPLKEEEPDTVN